MSIADLAELTTTDGHHLCSSCSDPITPDDPHDDCTDDPESDPA